MGINQRLARAAKVPFDKLSSLGVPDNLLVFVAVTSVIGLSSYQVVFGKSKGQTLSQEKPDVLVHSRGPRSLDEEKAALVAAGKSETKQLQ